MLMSPTERHRTWAAINGMNTGEKRMIKCESIQIGKKNKKKQKTHALDRASWNVSS